MSERKAQLIRQSHAAFYRDPYCIASQLFARVHAIRVCIAHGTLTRREQIVRSRFETDEEYAILLEEFDLEMARKN